MTLKILHSLFSILNFFYNRFMITTSMNFFFYNNDKKNLVTFVTSMRVAIMMNESHEMVPILKELD